MKSKRVGNLGLLLILYLFVNGLLTLFRWFPEYDFLLLLAPSWESVVLFIVLGLVSLLPASARTVILVVSAVVTALYFIFGFGETVNQYAFQDHFVPWTDMEFISPLIDMIFKINTNEKPMLLIAGGLIVLAAVTIGFYFLLRAISTTMEKLRFLNLSLLIYVAPALLIFGSGTPLTALFVRQMQPPPPPVIEEAEGVQYENTEPRPEIEYAFPFLRDKDIYVFIVESYGHTLFSRDDHFTLIEPVYRRLEHELDSNGYAIVSNFLRSPITGGRSWFADATLLTGVWVDSQDAYDSLTVSGVTNLTHILNNAGYRTIMSAPGTVKASETWKQFYRFDEYYFSNDFGYTGPHFAFGEMPDQFQLNWLRKGPLSEQNDNNNATDKTADQNNIPIFLMSMLVSSHTPFNSVPAYIEDWDTIGDGSEYHILDNPRFNNNWISGEEYPEGYIASIEYTLNVLTEFFVNYIEDDGLIIVIGDHQPRFPVREKDSTKSVVMHVLSRNHSLLDPFLDYEFTQGMVPTQEPPHSPLDTFAPMLLDVISGGSYAEKADSDIQ